MKEPIQAQRLVATYDFAPIKTASQGEDLKLRLEVFQSKDGFVGKVYRRETYRMQPTFSNSSAEMLLGDHEVLVREEFLGFDDLAGENPERILAELQARIARLLGRS